MGSIVLRLKINDLDTEAKFYVINTDTSYRVLLGRPWLHDNWVVPSTLHQCFKYFKDGQERKVAGDLQPFSIFESYYDYAQDFREETTEKKKGKQEDEQTPTSEDEGSTDDSDSDPLEVISKPSSSTPPLMKLNDNRTVDLDSEEEDPFEIIKTGTYVAVPPPTINLITVPEDLTKKWIRYQVNAVQSLKTFLYSTLSRLEEKKESLL